MVRKRKSSQSSKVENDKMTLSDALGDDVLAKLKAAKNELSAEQRKKEKERQAQLLRERKEREKNKTFEQLLEEYGDKGSKY